MIINSIETIRTATIRAMKPRNLPKDSNLCSSGVLGVSASAISLAMRPNSVFIPVDVTMPTARPVEMVVPMKSMFLRSANKVSGGRASECVLVGIDSPVNADSSTLHCHDSFILRSAGTFKPSSSFTISPGTRLVVLTSISRPSLQTMH